MEERPNILTKYPEGLVYTISAFSLFSLMMLGPILFMIPMIFIGAMKESLPLMDYLSNEVAVSIDSYVSGCISHSVLIIVSFFVFYKLFLKDLINFKNNWVKMLIVIVVGCLLLFVSGELMEIIYKALGVDENTTSQNQESILFVLASRNKWFMVIYSVILAPILEEIIFRKLLYSALKKIKNIPTWLVVIIVASIFAFIHVASDIEGSIIFFPQYFVLSLILTLGYALSKENFFASYGLHLFNNVVAVIAVL